MIGSLDVISGAPFTAEFKALLDECGDDLPAGQAHYHGMLYEPSDLPVVVHIMNENTGNSKVQFLDMPTRTMAECNSILRRIFDADHLGMRVLRLHLGCDVPTLPVGFFKNNVRVMRKQSSQTYSRLLTETTRKKVETVYSGTTQNGVTIYDKAAERRNAHKKTEREAKKFGTQKYLPQFEEFAGFSVTDELTRIEVKYDHRNVPPELDTVGKLIANAMDFNPFSNFRFAPSNNRRPCVDTLGFKLYRKAVTWQSDVDQFGFDGAYKLLLKHFAANTGREYAQIVKALDDGQHSNIDTEYLIERYRSGIERQLIGISQQRDDYDDHSVSTAY